MSSGKKTLNHSPLLYDYLKRYQEDPTSRIFAPLAEAYRKAGLVEEAIEIAREGLRIHPNFVGGRVALARALFDQGQFEEVITELSIVIRDVPDNLAAQKLLGESCLMTGRLAEALGAYKMLLYYSPYDKETARIVQELENQAYEQGALVLRKDPEPQVELDIQVRSANEAISNAPEVKRAKWVNQVEVLQNLLVRLERNRDRAVS
jgi:tetratricopeptide (TPR) repeat protein